MKNTHKIKRQKTKEEEMQLQSLVDNFMIMLDKPWPTLVHHDDELTPPEFVRLVSDFQTQYLNVNGELCCTEFLVNASGSRRTSILSVQLDNCPGQNKNNCSSADLVSRFANLSTKGSRISKTELE
jgi:hypothetical protein